jgi:4-hydroxybenzoate polyprenyltransferase
MSEKTVPPLLPLCVDLDGTLVRTDTLIESLLLLVKRNPLYLFAALRWLLGGKARFKAEVARRVSLNVATLPYQEDFLVFLREQKRLGRRLALVTAADRCIAESIAAHVGLFDEVFSSDGAAGLNLSGARKAELLTQRFGPRGFAYAGNAEVDRRVWSEAGGVILVNAPESLRRRVAREHPVEAVFASPAPTLRTWLRALRIHQWAKNTLLFIPFLAAHQWGQPAQWLVLAEAFLAFGCCASGVYILNDLLDLEADRHHARKRQRPFAAGALPLTHGAAMLALLLGAGLGMAALVGPAFLGMLLLYCALTFGYSFWFKRVEIVDVIVLASLYTIRLVAGGSAVAVPLSAWLLAFAMFMFLSLALVKRFTELLGLKKLNQTTPRGRGYAVSDLEPIASMGAASGYLSVLVLALYINSPEVVRLYHRPAALWALCPLVFYWVSRIWLLAHRDELHEDPIVFALEDRRSYLLGIIGTLILLIAQPSSPPA